MKADYKKAYYNNIPVYYNQNTKNIEGRNWFYNILVAAMLLWDVYIKQVDQFNILIEEDKK